jgi:lipid II:glycine glycyltransferase (peptidoglycan interpeptide bridge formation enzyme)
MQTSWWADFRATTGYENFGVTLKDQQEIVGGAVVMRFAHADDACFYYVPDGPVLPNDDEAAGDVFAAILQAVDARRKTDPLTVSHLRIEPRWLRLPGFIDGFQQRPEIADGYMEPRNTLCVDLRPDESAILAQMKPKGRYNIKVAQRHGVSVVEDASPQGRADFVRIYDEMAERQRITAKPPEYFETLVPLLVSKHQGSLFFAEFQGLRLAAAVTVHFGRRATYFFGGSVVEHREVMAPYLLHFEIMRRAKALGCEWYDFWGIAPENAPEHPWQNFSTFKRKFGGQDLHLVPTLDYVYDASAYDQYLRSVA